MPMSLSGGEAKGPMDTLGIGGGSASFAGGGSASLEGGTSASLSGGEAQGSMDTLGIGEGGGSAILAGGGSAHLEGGQLKSLNGGSGRMMGWMDTMVSGGGLRGGGSASLEGGTPALLNRDVMKGSMDTLGIGEGGGSAILAGGGSAHLKACQSTSLNGGSGRMMGWMDTIVSEGELSGGGSASLEWDEDKGARGTVS